MVFIHGNSSCRGVFRHQLAGRLAGSHRLIAFDLPGHGESGDAPEPMRTYTRPGLAGAVLELLDRLALAEAVVVGWSLGGHIGIEMIPRFKGMLGLMIIGAPPVSHGQMALGFSHLPQAAGKQDLTEAEIEEFVQVIFGASAEPFLRDAVARADGRFRRRLFEAARAGAGVDQRFTVETSTVPLAVVNGGADRLVNLDYFDNVAYGNLWEGRCHRVAGAGHAPFWDAPDRFDPVLERFLRDLKSGRAVPRPG